MVAIEEIRASNSRIATSLTQGLVAVFVGATSGVGEATLKQFARHAVRPRVYFIGRSKEAGARILAECRQINPDGQFTFIPKELSLIKNVDEVCNEIKDKEKSINLLFLTIGTLQAGIKTSEGLHYAAALVIHSRNRFIANLLPEIQNASSLRRVVSTFLGGMEGNINMNDFQGWHMGLLENKGHGSSITTLMLEKHARNASDVTFIHNFPGPVKGGILRGTKGVGFGAAKMASKFLLPMIQMPSADAGDRHVFLATSARFPAEASTGVPLQGQSGVAKGSDGRIGSGVYSVDLVGESLKQGSEDTLAKLRAEGMGEKVWNTIEKEYIRITGSKTG